MYRNYRALVISVIMVLSFFILNSCGHLRKKEPERNIDVDSEIYIVPIGDNVDAKYLEALVPKLEERFTTKVHVALDKRLPNPDYRYYNYEKEKFLAMNIVMELEKVEVPENAKILGVVNVDIISNPADDREFVLGQSRFSGGKAALISMYPMNPTSYKGGKPDDELVIERMVKESVRELGHLFGIKRCKNIKCVMYKPESLKELDEKGDSFCLKSVKEFERQNQPEP